MNKKRLTERMIEVLKADLKETELKWEKMDPVGTLTTEQWKLAKKMESLQNGIRFLNTYLEWRNNAGK